MVSVPSILEDALKHEWDDSNDTLASVTGLKTDLDAIIHGVFKSWAPLKATVASVVAKISTPDWDTRYHQVQIGGTYSLRQIDKSFVSAFLYKHGLYDTSTEFALTRSFEKAEPFTKSYSGKIRPQECKAAFLNIVETINTSPYSDNETLLRSILAYLIKWLKNRQQEIERLRLTKTSVTKTRNISLSDISTLCDALTSLPSGSSVVPVIMVRSLLCVISPLMWPSITVKPLKSHTASDKHSQAQGDIEAYDQASNQVIVIEIKHKLLISDIIIKSFDDKTQNLDIPMKCILTTADIPHSVTETNISVDTVKRFVLSYLQQALMFDRTAKVMADFVEQYKRDIVEHTNLKLEIKKCVLQKIEECLVSPAL